MEFQTDNAAEFIKLKPLLQESEIILWLPCPYSNQQMGSVERCLRHLIDMALPLLHQVSLPQNFWEFAVMTVVFLYNQKHSQILGNKSPVEVLMNKKPKYTSLRIFRSMCFPFLRPYHAHKLDHKPPPCIFLGYVFNSTWYLCFDPFSNEMFTSKDASFIEGDFSLSTLNQKMTKI